jgi:3-hydroxyacyl-CoA dehydrogenase/enoyl-CoA hydratase/3-hydroxybutyryl-CoA epimerase
LPIPPRCRRRRKTESAAKDGRAWHAWETASRRSRTAEGLQAPEDLEDRLILPLLNEAVACCTTAWSRCRTAGCRVIFGTGFAPFRGGPIQHPR